MQTLKVTSSTADESCGCGVVGNVLTAEPAKSGTIAGFLWWSCVLTNLVGLPPGPLVGFVTNVTLAVPALPCRVTETPKHLTASGVIDGPTLGHWSAIISVVVVGATILVALSWWSVSKLPPVALDMLGKMALGVTIDAFGPISDHSRNIGEVSQVNEWIQKRPGVLDAAGGAAATTDKDLAKGSSTHIGHTLLELSASKPQLREWTPTIRGSSRACCLTPRCQRDHAKGFLNFTRPP